MGWTYRPNSRSKNGLYAFNSQGIRSPVKKYSDVPKLGVLRIALFGDSFTLGEDVPFSDTWGNLLEKRLRDKGIAVEVLNFGVGGYGMDQAFLRWQKVGRNYSPQVVIFGFQVENLRRNVNIIRALHWFGSKSPFTKPRFILNDGILELINSPAIPPEKLSQVLKNIQTWNLVQYEYFYNPKDFHEQIWFHSKLVSLLHYMMFDNVPYAQKPYFLDDSVEEIGYRIVEKFAECVRATGAEFIIVNIPKGPTLRQLFRGNRQPGENLLTDFETDYIVIRSEEALAKEKSVNAICREHYTKKGNEILAEVVAEKFFSILSRGLLQKHLGVGYDGTP